MTSRVAEDSVVLCDNRDCREGVLVVVDGVVLPGSWREVRVEGWDGTMHACSDQCEATIRAFYEQGGGCKCE